MHHRRLVMAATACLLSNHLHMSSSIRPQEFPHRQAFLSTSSRSNCQEWGKRSNLASTKQILFHSLNYSSDYQSTLDVYNYTMIKRATVKSQIRDLRFRWRRRRLHLATNLLIESSWSSQHAKGCNLNCLDLVTFHVKHKMFFVVFALFACCWNGREDGWVHRIRFSCVRT